MRVAVLPDGLVTIDQGLHVERGGHSWSIPSIVADAYYPVGTLAVDPKGERAWVRAEDGRATRVHLRSGSKETFDFSIRDAAYDPSGTIVAVLDGPDDTLPLVELHDDAPTEHRPLSLPEPRRIHWPFGQPYRFAAYDLDWYGALRLSATRHGVALAHVNGMLWARFADGHQGAWRIPPVYQGWTCAYPHEHGLVVSSVHNGRTGDFVWLDREGVWHEAFDSNWNRVSPCVPTSRGFVAVLGEGLVRFEGVPATITEQVFVGGRPEDASVDPELGRMAVAFDSCRAELSGDGTGPVVVHRKGETSAERWERMLEPPTEEPWHFEAVDDPDLGRIWRPPVERVDALVSMLRELHARNPAAASEAAAGLLRQATLSDETTAAEIEPAVWRALQRWVSPSPSRASITRIVERLALGPEDRFEEHALRSALPEPWWTAGGPTLPAESWVGAHVPSLHGGHAGATTVVHAEILADPRRRPPWSLVASLEDGTSLRILLERFDPAILSGEPSETSDETELVRGTLLAEGSEPRSVFVEIDPLPGHLAQRVTVTPKDGGDVVLQTGAQVRPVVLSDPDDARVLAYGSESWPRLFVGHRDGVTVVGLFADELEGARPLPKPAPRSDVVALLDALVADELLELHELADDALHWEVEVALGTATSLDSVTAALEELLLDHPWVDELFADPDELRRRIAPLWPSGQS